MTFAARSVRLLAAGTLLVAAVAAGSLVGAPAASAGGFDYAVTNGNNAGPGSYRAAINDAEDDTSPAVTIRFDRDLHVLLTNDVLYGGDADLTIQGSGSTIDGQGQNQILVADEVVGITLDHLTLTGGDSDAAGGAIEAPDASVEAEGATFTDNHADGDGGAVHADSVRTEQTTFSANTAGNDGGAVDTTSAGHDHTTFSGNAAGGAGGAVSADFDATFVEATLAGNASPAGAHVSTTELDLQATVLADGSGSSACDADRFEDPTEDAHGYEEAGTSCGMGDPTSVESGPDPQLGSLTPPTGKGTAIHLPAATSPLVDAYAAPCATGYDQRGAARPQDGDGDGSTGCDIGAVERREASFLDVVDGHPFFTEVEWMADSGISVGYQPGPLYRPGDPVSRQAMSAFLYRFAGEPAFPDPATATFGDVSPANPFFTEIEWMAAEGISEGTPASPKPLYKPSAAVSRMAMSAFLFRFEGDTFNPPATPTFTDVGTTHPFFTEIEWMADAGISDGYLPGPTYRPASAVSRQAMSAFLYRLD